ncbi:hypothetical protein SKAU_G00039570 [Synaphobranchus kaupii]|uniref:Uncharacterized protein n=1 Tax=Synaphobranchus kaupii TaxID=118154 RepID=A0A9Q1GFG8_SYNKA|nr:hypothetical protein SKAU_G00039570 [Synaphobranchus kaupii]
MRPERTPLSLRQTEAIDRGAEFPPGGERRARLVLCPLDAPLGPPGSAEEAPSTDSHLLPTPAIFPASLPRYRLTAGGLLQASYQSPVRPGDAGETRRRRWNPWPLEGALVLFLSPG